MNIAELKPLLQKVEALRNNPETKDVYEDVVLWAKQASTPSMGQSVCSRVISMCHPKAWGDRYVSALGYDAWDAYLSELVDVANACGQAIYDNHP